MTSSSVNDWLKDRWQAAMDMSGTPIEVCEDLGLSGLGLGFRLKLKTLWQAVLCHWEVKGLGFGV